MIRDSSRQLCFKRSLKQNLLLTRVKLLLKAKKKKQNIKIPKEMKQWSSCKQVVFLSGIELIV